MLKENDFYEEKRISKTKIEIMNKDRKGNPFVSCCRNEVFLVSSPPPPPVPTSPTWEKIKRMKRIDPLSEENGGGGVLSFFLSFFSHF